MKTVFIVFILDSRGGVTSMITGTKMFVQKWPDVKNQVCYKLLIKSSKLVLIFSNINCKYTILLRIPTINMVKLKSGLDTPCCSVNNY